MDDGAGKIADDGQAFGLDDFAEVELVEFAQAVADFLQQAEGQRRANVRGARAFRRAGMK